MKKCVKLVISKNKLWWSLKMLSQCEPKDTEWNHESLRIGGILVEIWIRDLPKTKTVW